MTHVRDADVIARYQRRRDEHETSSELAAAASRRVGWARLAVFLATPAAAYLLARDGASHVAVSGLVVVGILGFSALVRVHRRYRSIERRERALAVQCAQGIARIRRDWGTLPPFRDATIDVAGHAFADDLDVFGDASLARILGPTGAVIGGPVMGEWLLAELPPDVERLRERQAAIAELAPRDEWRESFAVLGQSTGTSPRALERFLTWAESSNTVLPAIAYAIACALTILTLALGIRTLLVPNAAAPFVSAVVVNIAFTLIFAARMTHALKALSSRGFDWGAVSSMLEETGRAGFENVLLKGLVDRAEPATAGAFRRLAALESCAEVRHSPMGYAVLQALTLWDFHVVAALARWRRSHGTRMRERLRALAEIEAYSALAFVAYENPEWVYPRFDDSSTIDAHGLGHPLLPAASRVENDVAVGPRGTFLLVTGSNMAGKSTLLRTIGLNVILAQLGAPVCARAMSLARVRVRTVMHVRDSIATGTSLFLAEVLRIRDVVTAARDANGPLLLYLADEILHGTNADDRRIAIGAILSELLEHGAIGAMATHLVGLETEPSLASHARPVHFTEHYEDTPAGPVMRFDYRLRPGPATTRNALRLLESLGVRAR